MQEYTASIQHLQPLSSSLGVGQHFCSSSIVSRVRIWTYTTQLGMLQGMQTTTTAYCRLLGIVHRVQALLRCMLNTQLLFNGGCGATLRLGLNCRKLCTSECVKGAEDICAGILA